MLHTASISWSVMRFIDLCLMKLKYIFIIFQWFDSVDALYSHNTLNMVVTGGVALSWDHANCIYRIEGSARIWSYFSPIQSYPWWRHQMETFSALLAICAGNSPVPGEFPAQRPVTRSFDVFFDLRVNKRLSKQSRGWWLETLSHPLWRRCNTLLT